MIEDASWSLNKYEKGGGFSVLESLLHRFNTVSGFQPIFFIFLDLASYNLQLTGDRFILPTWSVPACAKLHFITGSDSILSPHGTLQT